MNIRYPIYEGVYRILTVISYTVILYFFANIIKYLEYAKNRFTDIQIIISSFYNLSIEMFYRKQSFSA